MFDVVEVKSPKELDSYAEPWAEALSRAEESDFFGTYEWLSAWLDCFWRDRPIAFLLVQRNGALMGLAPLLRDNSGDLGCPHTLLLPVNSHAPRSGVIHTGAPDGVMAALLSYLGGGRGRVRLGLRQLRVSSSSTTALPRLVESHRLSAHVREGTASPIIRIEGDWDSYLKSRCPQVARELRRKVRKAQREQRLEWFTASTPEQCEQVLPDVVQIEQNSWKQRAGSSFAAHGGLFDFYRRLARACARRGWLRLHLLYFDFKPVAHLYGVEYKGEYYAFKTSYDEAYRAWSPGAVLFAHALEDAFQRRLTTFDFLGVESRWKAQLANDLRRHVDICVYSPRAYSCRLCTLHDDLYTHRLKRYVREKLPAVVALKRKLLGFWR